ncbi:MAG: hypothetical protein A3F09_02230 [Chlamydiae bacterium RIFCSPHIGHO2_12_FULL_49_11]|nr:MAG: hypothetical protein A3F09_02230 [Chlamydiae bacterium RIFCSPHIGHO2_12_FULL_49_11]
MQEKIRVGFAESCTGGAISSTFIRFPGASRYMIASVVAYADDAKELLCGVRREALQKYGAVSKEVALEMAEGIFRQLCLDLAVSVTGLFGPGGGSTAKPVGTVYVAIRRKEGGSVHELPIPSGLTRSGYFRETVRQTIGLL